MPNWLRGMVAPTLMLWLCVVSFGIVLGASYGLMEISTRADLVSRFAFPLVLASWVTADARKRGRQLCYDYDSFVFFFGPVVVPVYLFQTRGVQAFLTLLCFAGIILVACFAALGTFLIRAFVLS